MATGKLFVKEGAYVFIMGRRQKELDEAVKAIGRNVTGIQGDVAKLTDLDHLYEAVKRKGRIDAVFANASVAEFAPMGKITEEHLDRLFNINVKVRSNVISPRPTDTPAIDGQPADAVARILSTIPMGRMGEPDGLAKAALFLASDDSSFVTGIELFVDSGRAQI